MTKVWPAMTDYAEAVQDPAAFFRVPALAQAEFATMPPFGLPAVASGQNAVVFTAKIGATSTAVRCFTGECADGRDRYVALGEHVTKRPVPAMASAQWLDDAIELNGEVWPAITMEWVSGDQLHDFVEQRLHHPAELTTLAHRWVDICRSMREAELAHGDLQHGNVIVEATGAIRLIDFDGVWIDEVGGSPPSEVGHPNYQHPNRGSSGAWGWSIDWFSALNVLVSIRGLAADPTLWDLHMGENLIFREEDFWGDADIWSRLEGSPDADVREWSYLLAEACAHPADSPYDLSTILDRGLVAVDVGSPISSSASAALAPSASSASPSSSGGEQPDVELDSREVEDEWAEASRVAGQWWIAESLNTTNGDSDATVAASAQPDDHRVTRASNAAPDSAPTPDAAAEPADLEWGAWAGGTSPGATTSASSTGSSRSNGTASVAQQASAAHRGSSRAPGQKGARPPSRERPVQQPVQSSWSETPAAASKRSVPPASSPPSQPSNNAPYRAAPMYSPTGAPSHSAPAQTVPVPAKRRFNVGLALGYLMIAAMIGLVVISIVTGTE